MNIKFFNIALGLALTATTISASAQKVYDHGTIMLNTDMRGQSVQATSYFTKDSLSMSFTTGPATIKILADSKSTFFAILVDVPVASIKKAAVYTPAEIEQQNADMPKLTFVPGTETKMIGKFNCKKIVATDAKTKKTYDIWITNDVTIPANAISKYYAGIGGFPIQYTSFSQGQEAAVTVTDITDAKAPAGTFVIAPDFDKITLDELKSMRGGN